MGFLFFKTFFRKIVIEKLKNSKWFMSTQKLEKKCLIKYITHDKRVIRFYK